MARGGLSRIRRRSRTIRGVHGGSPLPGGTDHGGLARVEEAVGAVLAFVVTLERAASGTVTVDYATADGTATAGADYTATSGTLRFAAGETSKTVSVTVLDDAHDDGGETVTLTLSNPSGGRLTDGQATGTIENRDPLPRALLARFDRSRTKKTSNADPHRRIRLQRRRVDTHRPAPHQARVGELLPHPGEHRRMGLDAQQPPRPRDRRVVGRRRRRRQTQERPQTQRIGRTPRHRPLRVEAFDIPHPQQPDITPRRQTRPPHPRRERRAQLLNACIEARRAQDLDQPFVEGMPAARGKIRRGDPHRVLGPVVAGRAHRHGAAV